MKDNEAQIVLIIGAARSGTKILRKSISTHNEVNAIPYDINFIWRYGNENSLDDELRPKNFSEPISDFINRFVLKYKKNSAFILEKTVSNCLRVEYTNLIFPKAKYIHLVRNPFDVIESAYRQWEETPNINYLLRKSLKFPILHCFNYVMKYLINEIQRVLTNTNKKSGTWGPRYKGIDNDLQEKHLWEVCTIQWQKCYLEANKGLSSISAENQLFIKYEDFVLSPTETMIDICTFLSIENTFNKDFLKNSISKKNIGKGSEIPPEYYDKIRTIIHPQLVELGYSDHVLN